MVEIVNCPSLLVEGFSTYCPKARKLLFSGKTISHFLDFNLDDEGKNEKMVNAMHWISVSGVQEKIPAVLKKGKIQIVDNDEQSTYILKPTPWDKSLTERKQMPANEHLTMQIANQVYGIVTAANGLCFTPDGQTVYITKRFDVNPDNTKLPMEDFASIIGRSEDTDGKYFKYNGNYGEIAEAIKKYVSAWMVDLERFFNLLVFNYIYANGDAHLKNYSLILQGEDYRLSPAYDLLNTSIHINDSDFALEGGLSPNIIKSEVYKNTGHPCRTDFERFAEHIGLLKPRVDKILDRYMELPEMAESLVARSFLFDKQKRYYVRIVKERIARFKRISD